MPVTVLIDFGADERFMDVNLSQQLSIHPESLPTVCEASVLDGQLLSRVTHRAVPLTLRISGNHSKTPQFYLLLAPHFPLILGYSWLLKDNPHLESPV